MLNEQAWLLGKLTRNFTTPLLRWRLILGFAFILGLVGLCWLDHTVRPRGMFLSGLALLLCGLATGEVLCLVRAIDARPVTRTVYGASFLPLAVVILGLLADGLSPANPPPQTTAIRGLVGETAPLGPALLTSFVLCGVSATMRFDGTKQCAIDLAASVFIVMYVGGSIAMLTLLRWMDSNGAQDRGLIFLVATIVIVKMGDTGAYGVGRLMGRRKLAPRLSPAKTWEGALGGLACSWAAGMGIYTFCREGNASAATTVEMLIRWSVFSVVLSAAGMAGDLLESLLKRCASIKDSSRWLPGFGGVLDMLDSLLLAGPVAYWFVATGVVQL